MLSMIQYILIDGLDTMSIDGDSGSSMWDYFVWSCDNFMGDCWCYIMMNRSSSYIFVSNWSKSNLMDWLYDFDSLNWFTGNNSLETVLLISSVLNETTITISFESESKNLIEYIFSFTSLDNFYHQSNCNVHVRHLLCVILLDS